MTELKFDSDRPTFYFNPKETCKVKSRYITIGRLLQAASEMEYLIPCWIDTLLEEQGKKLLSRNQLEDKDFSDLKKIFLEQLNNVTIDTTLKNQIVSKMDDAGDLRQVRNIVAHNPLLTGDKGIPQTRNNWKGGSKILSEKEVKQAVHSLREICDLLYEGHLEAWNGKVPYVANFHNLKNLSDDLD